MAGEHPIDTGTATLERDPYSSTGWLLKVNGVPSSHVDLADPGRLDFEYMRWMAALITERFVPGRPGEWPARPPREEAERGDPGADGAAGARPAGYDAGVRFLRAAHLGGGACSMARWIAAEYGDARQLVVELDGRLAELVRGWFDLPRSPQLRIRAGEAGAELARMADASRDLVIRDVFAGDRTPVELTGGEFTAQAARVLDAGGLYVVNCGDGPALENARREAGMIGSVFRHTAVVADAAMLKGRRRGNVVIAGSEAPIPGGPTLRRELLGGGVPAQFWDDARVRAFAGGR
ncbi:spermidine synthase [Zafaria sp. J156]|uniref:spermidine synthase n=1 Tax=Zafaria sp. J156 TaxID=3116490 RepID=UPI003D35A714